MGVWPGVPADTAKAGIAGDLGPAVLPGHQRRPGSWSASEPSHYVVRPGPGEYRGAVPRADFDDPGPAALAASDLAPIQVDVAAQRILRVIRDSG